MTYNCLNFGKFEGVSDTLCTSLGTTLSLYGFRSVSWVGGWGVGGLGVGGLGGG